MKRPSRKHLLRWILFLVIAAIIGLYIILPAGLGVAALSLSREAVGAPPDGFEAVQLATGDGLALSAWYKPPSPANGTAIVLAHGAGGSRESVRRYVEMLARHGYGVLALDLRGHGSSEGATNRFGWQGTRDIGAAVAYLQARAEVERIGGMGLSLGGEVLLGAASTYPALEAIVADGATHRCVAELLALPSEQPLYRNFTARVMYASVQIFSGAAPPEPLLDSMIEAESTTYLLIAGGGNQNEVDFNTLFAETVGDRAVLWVAPDAPHTGAFDRYPDEYEQRVLAFLDAAFGSRH
ncbi:MAG: alpha/beta fold hydrolase [Anaerolineae bacterium]|nr:alpha/beta fold hydrolase [Anaerolineae bacterium]